MKALNTNLYHISSSDIALQIFLIWLFAIILEQFLKKLLHKHIYLATLASLVFPRMLHKKKRTLFCPMFGFGRNDSKYKARFSFLEMPISLMLKKYI